jgi:preprotein translocase subunit SecA
VPLFRKSADAGMLAWCRDVVARTGEFGPAMGARDDRELRDLTPAFRERLARGESLDDLLPEAFAAVREAASRTLGQRHYDVQIMGAAAAHRGAITEMRTGEGKTLTITLAAYLNALPGDGVHVLTASDYLASRDAEWMRPVYAFLGLETGALVPHRSGASDIAGRREQYEADITYGSASEFCYDYLYDNLAERPDMCVQRGLNLAIVDEADLILLDEARTTPQVSAALPDRETRYPSAAELAARLRTGLDYTADHRARTISLTESGMRQAEEQFQVTNLYDTANLPLVQLVENALKARELWHRDRDYLVEDGRILAVDPASGRPVPDRVLPDGELQAIEAKEGLPASVGRQVKSLICAWDYLGKYPRLTGLTGTAASDADAYREVYRREVAIIPTNRPMIRVDHPDVFYGTQPEKLAALAAEAATRQQRGQPVLVGASSVEQADQISLLLENGGVAHEVLTARNHEHEARIMASAGVPGAVTVVAKMAGRGVDIVLGGPDGAHRDRVADLGGLCVLGAERPVTERIELHLRGRAGRQGDPGESKLFVSMEDEIVQGVGERARTFGGKVADGKPWPAMSHIFGRLQAGFATGQLAQLRQGIEYDTVLAEQSTAFRAERHVVFAATNLREQTRAIVAAAYGQAGLNRYDEREAELTPTVLRTVERILTLRVMDLAWARHLRAMTDALGEVALRSSTGGGPPLPSYQREAALLYDKYQEQVGRLTAQVLLKETVERLKGLS